MKPGAKCKTYSAEIIATIRAIDPDNIILVGSPHWDQDIHMVADDPLVNVKNIMYTVHFYAARIKSSCGSVVSMLSKRHSHFYF